LVKLQSLTPQIARFCASNDRFLGFVYEHFGNYSIFILFVAEIWATHTKVEKTLRSEVARISTAANSALWMNGHPVYS
jgi:hypothetical protein